MGPMDGAGAAVEEEDVAGGRRSLPRRRRRNGRRYGQGNGTVQKKKRGTPNKFKEGVVPLVGNYL